MSRREGTGSHSPGTDRDVTSGSGEVDFDAVALPRGRLAAIWHTICAVIGGVMGLLPHVLHHIGVLAGAALVTGAGGNLMFFALGLAFSVPLLRRLYARFHTWRAPAIAIAVFAVMFSLSAFVIGPVIAGDSSPADAPNPPSDSPPDTHTDHH